MLAHPLGHVASHGAGDNRVYASSAREILERAAEPMHGEAALDARRLECTPPRLLNGARNAERPCLRRKHPPLRKPRRLLHHQPLTMLAEYCDVLCVDWNLFRSALLATHGIDVPPHLLPQDAEDSACFVQILPSKCGGMAEAEFRDIDQLSPTDFEFFVRDVFEAAGWTDLVVTEPNKEYRYGDGGVDIFGRREDRRYAIEVKQRTAGDLVGVPALNQLVAGAELANVPNRILVSNSYFTSEAKGRALRLGVELVDRDALQSLWIQKHTEIGSRIRPRKYQQAIIDEVLSRFQNGADRFLIEMATGLGKTYTAAHIARRVIHDGLLPRPR